MFDAVQKSFVWKSIIILSNTSFAWVAYQNFSIIVYHLGSYTRCCNSLMSVHVSSRFVIWRHFHLKHSYEKCNSQNIQTNLFFTVGNTIHRILCMISVSTVETPTLLWLSQQAPTMTLWLWKSDKMQPWREEPSNPAIA